VRLRVKGVWAKAVEAKVRRRAKTVRKLGNTALTEEGPP
jgi:hypothetical protein